MKQISADLALATGHLIEGGAVTRRIRNYAAAATALNVSTTRVSHLVGLTALAPDIQSDVIDLHGSPLGALSERTLYEVVASHADWDVQRWWWSLLAQPFNPDWIFDSQPASALFPSGACCGPGDRAIGGLPLRDLAELVGRRRGQRDVAMRREDLLVALADDAAPAPRPMIAMVAAMGTLALDTEYRRLYDHRPPSRHPEYLRRRVTWGLQAREYGDLGESFSDSVLKRRKQLPDQWRLALGDVEREHVTWAHRVAQRGTTIMPPA